MVVELGHGAHGGAAGAHRVGLVDGNRGRHTLDLVDSRLIHAVQKLARIGTEGLHVAALAFGKQGVEHQAGLARSAWAGDHGQLTGADVQIEIFEVVLARTANADGSLRHEGFPVCEANILGMSARQAHSKGLKHPARRHVSRCTPGAMAAAASHAPSNHASPAR